MGRALRRIARWAGAHPFAACLVWALWLSAIYGLFGPHSYVRTFDNADGYLAMRSSTNFSVAGWDAFASWAHVAISGSDRGFLGLDGLPFLVLPGWLGYWLIMFLQRLIGAYFGFRLARDRWSLGQQGAWFFALWFSLFFQTAINDAWGGWTLYDGLTMAALPAIVWLLLSKTRPRWHLLVGAAVAGILYALTSTYAFAAFTVVLIAIVLVASGGWRRRIWLAFGVFAVTWVIASVPAALSGVLNSASSQRADWVSSSPLSPTNLPFWQQVTAALKIVRDNIVGIALGIWAGTRLKDRRTLLPLVAILVALVAFVFAQWGQAVLKAYGGPLGGFLFKRFDFWVPFLAATVGALGIHELQKRQGRAAVSVVAFVAVFGLSVAVNGFMAIGMVTGANYSAVFRDPGVVALRDRIGTEPPFRVATVVAANPGHDAPLPAYPWAQGLDTADGYLSLYPQRYQDFWERVIGPLITQDQNRYNYFHYYGSRVYLYEPTKGFPSGPVQVDGYYDLDLLALANVRYLISGVELADPRLHELSSPTSSAEGTLSKLRQWLGQVTGSPLPSQIYVYQLDGTLARAFVVGQAQSFPSRSALLDALAAATPKQLGQVAFFEQADGPIPQPEGGVAETPVLRRSPDRIQIAVEATAPALLVVTEQYSKFWSAEVDGAEVKVVPADGPFMAVAIPAGRHTVAMRYHPPYELPFLSSEPASD